MSHDRDRRLHDLAARQRGLFTREQARSFGVDPSTVSRRASRGMYERLRPGVFATAGTAAARERDLMEALLHVGGEAVLARATAAEVLDLPLHGDERVHVLVHARSWRGASRIVVHRTDWWLAEHVTEADGFPVTTAARTAVDLAGSCSYFQLRKLVTDVVRRRLATADDIRSVLQVMGRVRGAVDLKRILDELSPLHARTATGLESMFVDLSTGWGIPPTYVNHPARDVHGKLRYLDAAYVPEGLIVELDGERYHSLATDRADDQRRTNALLATGEWHRILRYGFHDLTERPAHVRRELEATLASLR